MEKLIRGQRAKINGLYDDAISLNIIESDELNNVLEKLIKPIDSSSDFAEFEQRILKGTPDPNKKIKIFRNKEEEAAT